MTVNVLRRRWLLAALAPVLLAPAACGTDTAPSTPVFVTPPASAPPSSAPAPPASGDCVEQTFAKMSPEQRAGQLLMIGTPVDEPRPLTDQIRRHHLGGAFLAGRSSRPAAALSTDIRALRESATTPLLVALDQEGGQVQTLKGPDFPRIPTAEDLGGGPPAKLRAQVTDSAKRLSGIGVSLNLGPVADTVPVSVGEANPPIGYFHRQYGSDPAEVAKDIEVVVKASQSQRVLTVLKHFPGLGRTRANTDTSTDAVDATATTTDPYLQPFASGIKAGSAAVMMSSATYPKLDPKTIAVFSKPIITDLLRKKLGFKGVVMSDDLGAAKAAQNIPAGERAVRFIAAGGDLALSIVPEDAVRMAAALTAEAAKDPAFAKRVDESARTVLKAKSQAGLLTCA